jgi:hypothetical protein
MMKDPDKHTRPNQQAVGIFRASTRPSMSEVGRLNASMLPSWIVTLTLSATKATGH